MRFISSMTLFVYNKISDFISLKCDLLVDSIINTESDSFTAKMSNAIINAMVQK